MALVVETGTGSGPSESYASVADADTLLADRGFALWATMNVPEKEQALRRATDYMIQMYRLRWAGFRKSNTQALDWPRYGVPMRDTNGYGGFIGIYGGSSLYPSYGGSSLYPSNSVPAIVRDACVTLAFKAASGDLSPDLAPRVTSESVGPISVTYAQGERQYVVYRAIDSMLAPVFKNNTGVLLMRS